MTRADAEQALLAVDRLGPVLPYLGLTAVTTTPIPALSGPISQGLHACGIDPDNPANPSDTDVAKLRNRDWWKFLDIAELRLLDAVVRVLVNRGTSQSWKDYSVRKDASSILSLYKDKAMQVRLQWGWGVPTVSAGVIRNDDPPYLDFSF